MWRKPYRTAAMSIIQADKSGERHFENDVIGFAFPCYAFRAPKIFDDFVVL
jgi:hypothetical protein